MRNIIDYAEGVRQFQPRVGALATTLGYQTECFINPEKGSPTAKPLQGSFEVVIRSQGSR